MIFAAYLCTTVSTVLAMITSFLASQHTFCYLQLQAERAKAVKNMNFDEADNDTILAKVYQLIISDQFHCILKYFIVITINTIINPHLSSIGFGKTSR